MLYYLKQLYSQSSISKTLIDDLFIEITLDQDWLKNSSAYYFCKSYEFLLFGSAIET